MSVYENEEEITSHDDAADAAALVQAEELILEVATEAQPASLSELRDLLANRASELDPSLLRAALWALLNENRLELTSERTLRVAG